MNDQERDDLVERVARALDVPETSPLFWEHFPGRVRAAVQAGPADTALRWWKRRAVLVAMSMAAVAVLASWAFFQEGSRINQGPAPAVTETSPLQHMEALDADAGWEVVTAVAASAGTDVLSEAGFGVAPGGVESAIETLNESERAELVSLLQAEMKVDDGGDL